MLLTSATLASLVVRQGHLLTVVLTVSVVVIMHSSLHTGMHTHCKPAERIMAYTPQGSTAKIVQS